MAQFLLLLHEPKDGFSGLSPEEMQAIIEKYHSWSDGMRQQGSLQEGIELRKNRVVLVSSLG